MMSSNSSSSVEEDTIETLHELFERQVVATPDALALLECSSCSCTFATLNQSANAFANYLLAQGCVPRDCIAVFMSHSIPLVVALLGILKMGGAFLAIDVHWPENRVKHVLTDATPSMLITDSEAGEAFGGDGSPPVCRIDLLMASSEFAASPCVARNLKSNIPSNTTAYIIYTSGSSGQPKGVLGTHLGMVNRIKWMWEAYPYKPHENCCAKTTLGFVDSISEIFTPLCHGVPVYLFGDKASKNPNQLISLLAGYKITRVQLVPSLLHTMLKLNQELAKTLPLMTHWEVSGEALTVSLAKLFASVFPHNVKLINIYGSSEVAADATFFEVSLKDLELNNDFGIPIGKSIPNMRVYIFDDSMQPVSVGEKGHIFIGGKGVSVAGYLNKPDITAKAFIPNPIIEDRNIFPILYKMGDIGSERTDGVLIYHGRSDHQVKINGIRVELGEIENAIYRVDNCISQCAVKYWPLHEMHGLLVAYVVYDEPLTVDMKTALSKEVPSYMVPAQFHKLDKLPLNNNGKIDRQSLPNPLSMNEVSRQDHNHHKNFPLVDKILAFLHALIGEELVIEATTEFLYMGMNSLMIVQLQAMIARECGVEINLKQILNSNNAFNLAELINGMPLKPGLIVPQTVKYYGSPVMQISITELSHGDKLSPNSGPFIDSVTGITYDLLTQKDVASATEFVTRVFCENEPITYHTCTPAHFTALYEPYIRAAAQEQLSVLAKLNGQIIGAIIAMDSYTKKQVVQIDHAWDSLVELLDSLQREEFVTSKPGHIVSSLVTAVEPSFFGYELSYTLEKLSAALATREKYEMIVTELTSPLSQSTAKQLGFQVYSMLMYNDFVDSTHHKPFLGLAGGAQLGVLKLI